MYPYPVKPVHWWGLGAILIALLLVAGVTVLVLSPGDSQSTPVNSPEGVLSSGEETQGGCSPANGCLEPGGDIDVAKLNTPVPRDAMTVTEGSTMFFDYGGESGEGFPYCEVSSLDSNDGFSLDCKWDGERVEVPANLPPGEYGLAINITAESGDDADFYGFHLLVEEAG